MLLIKVQTFRQYIQRLGAFTKVMLLATFDTTKRQSTVLSRMSKILAPTLNYVLEGLGSFDFDSGVFSSHTVPIVIIWFKIYKKIREEALSYASA